MIRLPAIIMSGTPIRQKTLHVFLMYIANVLNLNVILYWVVYAEISTACIGERML
jgi:hypothetical protein